MGARKSLIAGWWGWHKKLDSAREGFNFEDSQQEPNLCDVPGSLYRASYQFGRRQWYTWFQMAR